MHQILPKAALLVALLGSSAAATATAQSHPAEALRHARVAQVDPGSDLGGNRADARALTGPAFPGAKKCRGDVEAGVIGFDIRVRNGSCVTAKRTVRKARFRPNGGVSVKGWRCRQVGSYYEGGYYRCNRHRTTIQFGFGV
jgi:hypothetical protein